MVVWLALDIENTGKEEVAHDNSIGKCSRGFA